MNSAFLPSQSSSVCSDRCWVQLGGESLPLSNNNCVNAKNIDDNNTVNNHRHLALNDVSVETSHRRGQPGTSLPENMYASLRYIVKHTIRVPQDISMVFVKLTCVDPKSGREICRDGKPAMAGDTKLAATGTGGTLTCEMKLKFKDVSYHHGRRPFAWCVQYLFPGQVDVPALVIQSPPFFVYARRPNMGNPKSKQQQKNQNQQNLSCPNNGPDEKTTPPPNTLSDFASRLDDLVSLVSTRLSDEERKEALQLLAQRLLYQTNEAPNDSQLLYATYVLS